MQSPKALALAARKAEEEQIMPTLIAEKSLEEMQFLTLKERSILIM